MQMMIMRVTGMEDAELQHAQGHPKSLVSGGDAGHGELAAVQHQYLLAVRSLLSELEREGEPDFDGLLRNCINFLANKGQRVCY